jgi:hypothetical protein
MNDKISYYVGDNHEYIILMLTLSNSYANGSKVYSYAKGKYLKFFLVS